MTGPMASLGVFALIAGIIFSVGQGLIEVGKDALSGPEAVSLTVERFDYVDGHFYQHIAPHGREVVIAKWAAQILRDNKPICEGSGTAPYAGSTKKMTPDYWTYSTCPPLEPGDVAIASWQWTNEKSLTLSTSARLVIK